ncbi:MAG: hypothetical protein OSB41_04795 [Kiritimatiellae bacterium]|nr:hypothetical protein [Kiritimatiellia bacterium]
MKNTRESRTESRDKLSRAKELVKAIHPKPWQKYGDTALEALAKEPLQTVFRIAAASGFSWLLIYWSSIDYVPDVTLASLLLMLVSAALVGAFIVIECALIFVLPHLMWGSFWDGVTSLQKPLEPVIVNGVPQTPEPQYPQKQFFWSSIWILITMIAALLTWNLFAKQGDYICFILAITLFLEGLIFVVELLRRLNQRSSWMPIAEPAWLIIAISACTLAPFFLAYPIVWNGITDRDFGLWFLMGLETVALCFLIWLGSFPPHTYRNSRGRTAVMFAVAFIPVVFIPFGVTGQIAKAVASKLGLTQPSVNLYVKADACPALPDWLVGTTCPVTADASFGSNAAGDTGADPNASHASAVTEVIHHAPRAGTSVLYGIKVLNRIGPQWLLEATFTPDCPPQTSQPATSPAVQASTAVPASTSAPAVYRFTLRSDQILSAGEVRTPSVDQLKTLRCAPPAALSEPSTPTVSGPPPATLHCPEPPPPPPPHRPRPHRPPPSPDATSCGAVPPGSAMGASKMPSDSAPGAK